MPDAIARPRRSVLYMPGSNAKALEKAKGLAADCLIFDLEDAVALEAKGAARFAVGEAVRAGGYGAREIIVRINGLGTPWAADDLAAVLPAGPDAVLFPKIDGGEDVRAARAAIRAHGGGADLPFWVMIETPKALLALREIAEAGQALGLSGFVAGTNDLAKDLRVPATPDRAALQTALSLMVIAARAFGLAVLDGVHNSIEEKAEFLAQCRQGHQLGFDGKTLIHPSQIETANAVFSPAPEEIAWAQRVIAAFTAPEQAGRGVIKIDGKMAELLHFEEAKRVATLAARIAQMAHGASD